MDKTLNEERLKELVEFSHALGIDFHDIRFLHQALTHTSYANDAKKIHVVHNERLEFLGDAVLELIISSYLYSNFPDLPEGELTKARASVVCEMTLAKRAHVLNIGEYLLFGKGELATGGRNRTSILADAFEAIIGSIYMDQGIQNATDFVLGQLKEDLGVIKKGNYIQDYKTLLQEVVQKNSDSKIHYELISETGPDHDKIFHIAVFINQQKSGTGFGKSKKEAEQCSAKEALIKLNKVNL